MTFNQKLVGSKHILATDENDAVHAIKVFTIGPKDFKPFQMNICELFKF